VVACTFRLSLLDDHFIIRKCNRKYNHTAISIKVVHEQSEKSNTSAKGCWESLWKFINLLAIPSSLSRSYSTFPLCSWTTLIEIAVYSVLFVLYIPGYSIVSSSWLRPIDANLMLLSLKQWLICIRIGTWKFDVWNRSVYTVNLKELKSGVILSPFLMYNTFGVLIQRLEIYSVYMFGNCGSRNAGRIINWK
jgi:hypothetical protein